MTDASFLKKCYLFEHLTNDEIEKIRELAKEKDVIAGDYVFDEGAKAHSLYIVRYGTVEVLKKATDDERQVTQLSAGSHFGEMALVDHQNRSASVMAKENAKLIEIEFSSLEAIFEKIPAIGHKVYRSIAAVLCRRIRQTTSDLSSLKELKLRHL